MSVTLAFDVYGTLIDTQGVVASLETIMADKAPAFSQTWRDKQLEYSFRRGLMQNYENFAVCTRQALEYCCLHYAVALSDGQKNALIEQYKSLPAFADVEAGLSLLKNADVRLYAFSNGSREAVEGLLSSAGIKEFFDGIVSCDDIRSFKPNPGVYAHFLRESGALGSHAWLVSSNPFDVIGAISAGMRAAWVRRSAATVFDPWGTEPTVTVASLKDLHSALALDQE